MQRRIPRLPVECGRFLAHDPEAFRRDRTRGVHLDPGEFPERLRLHCGMPQQEWQEIARAGGEGRGLRRRRGVESHRQQQAQHAGNAHHCTTRL